MYVNVYLPSFTFSGSFITSKFIWILYFFMIFEFTSIVFRSRPVQGPGSGFWSSHRVGRVNFLNQNDVILVKKTKVNGLQSGFWSSLAGSPDHTGFFLILFFLQPDPVPALGWPAEPGQVSKLCVKEPSQPNSLSC